MIDKILNDMIDAIQSAKADDRFCFRFVVSLELDDKLRATDNRLAVQTPDGHTEVHGMRVLAIRNMQGWILE